MSVRLAPVTALASAPLAARAASGSRRLGGWARVAAGVLVAFALLGTDAQAGAVFAYAANSVEAEWDGPAVHLDWRGAEYARAEATFVGDRVASPGDRVSRQLNIVNAGPRDGIVAVTVAAEELVPEGAVNAELAADVTLFWDVGGVTGEESFAALTQRGHVTVAEVAVAQRQTVPIEFGFRMDSAVRSANAAGAPSAELRFEVGVNLREDASQSEIVVTGGNLVLLAALVALACLSGGLALLGRRRAYRGELASAALE